MAKKMSSDPINKKDLNYIPSYNWKESLTKTLVWYEEFFKSGSKAFESSFEKPDV